MSAAICGGHPGIAPLTRATLLAMTSARIPAARPRPGDASNRRSLKQRAQGMPGAQPHPQSSWAEKENAHKSSGRAEIARHSLRNGFTAYSALSLVCRAC